MGIAIEYFIIISLLFGLISYLYAKEKNLNPIKWFIIGCIFGLFSLIVIAAIKKKAAQK